jgi:predicted aconitase
VNLTDAEKAMLDGARGPAHRKAMELLVRYGEALGAERLVETNSVAGTWSVANPIVRDYAARGMDAVFSEFNLDSDEVVATPPMETLTCQLIGGLDRRRPDVMGVSPEIAALNEAGERYFGARGVGMHATCTPYQVGIVPVFGEHLAWMESSAVVYANAVCGARTNTEGRESTGAAALTRRIPYWGLHLPENRGGTHLVEVDVDVPAEMLDWGLLGYWVGEAVQDAIPVVQGRLAGRPSMIHLKHFGAAAASSGGVEMYHLPGITPEAPDTQAAFRGKAPLATLRYGAAERLWAYEALNGSARDRAVDFVMLGCPHNAVEQVLRVVRALEGRRVAASSALWVFAPRAIAEAAEASGYGEAIRAAGGQLMADTCPAISRIVPKGAKVVATDSAKQAHYLPAITGVQCWFGSVEDCVDAAVTGHWNGAPPC